MSMTMIMTEQINTENDFFLKMRLCKVMINYVIL